MADSDKAKGYRPKAYPTIEGGAPTYTYEEFKKISVALDQQRQVNAALEARIVALGG